MKLSQVAAKQKRIIDWSEFLENSVHDQHLHLQIVDTLKLYRNLLAKCWEAGEVTRRNQERLLELERQLENLQEDALLLRDKKPLH